MFTPGEIEGFSAVLDKPMRSLEMRIMEDIVRRIKINGEIMRSADWQINRLVQLGMAREDIQNALKDSLSLSDDEVADMYRNVIKSGYVRDKALYEAVGANFIPFEENGELQQLISAVAGQTNQTLKNITQSLGFAVRGADGKLSFTPIADYYQQTLDGAMLDIASGAFDYNTVLKRTVREITNSGLRTVDYATGWKNRVDVAARRAVMTGMTQLTAKINADNMEALGTDYVEVSWHGGARPTHQVWQGKIYYWDKGNRNDILENSQNTVDNSAESGIIKTGAITGAYNDENDPENKKREESAQNYYKEICNRNRKNEIEAISSNSGLTIEEADAIFSHVFEQEHKFADGSVKRFDPDYYMQQSFMRIRNGKNILPHDMTLLMHELIESRLMTENPDMVYEEAHAIAERQYNYKSELIEYLKNKSTKGE